jgi:hypothetical protein
MQRSTPVTVDQQPGPEFNAPHPYQALKQELLGPNQNAVDWVGWAGGGGSRRVRLRAAADAVCSRLESASIASRPGSATPRPPPSPPRALFPLGRPRRPRPAGDAVLAELSRVSPSGHNPRHSSRHPFPPGPRRLATPRGCIISERMQSTRVPSAARASAPDGPT